MPRRPPTASSSPREGEAVETAWRPAKQYYKIDGQADQAQGDQPQRGLPRHPAGRPLHHRHPCRQGDVRATGPGRGQVPNTNHYRAPEHLREDEEAFGRWAADRIAEAIEFEGPDTVAAVFLEPVQNSGGCAAAPATSSASGRSCDEYDVLLVSDEVICSFGRIGSMFACDDFNYMPDMSHTCAKGAASGYSPSAR